MKFKKWLQEWCNTYEFSDNKSEPSLKLFFEVLFRRFKGFTPIYSTRMFFQRIFRFNHLADCDTWEAQGTIARKVLPVLKAFKKMERHGYPHIYSSWDKHSGFTKEEYNIAIEKGTMIGGEEDAWNKDLDHIIHAIEYIAWEGNSKKISKWYIDNFGMDPYAKDTRNEYVYYTYLTKNGNHGMSFKNKPDFDVTELEEHTTNGNSELLDYIDTYVSLGLKKFGERWQNLWD